MNKMWGNCPRWELQAVVMGQSLDGEALIPPCLVQPSMFPVLPSGQGAPAPRHSNFGHPLRTFWAKECCDVWQFGPWYTPWSGLGEVLGGQSKNSEFLHAQAVLAEPHGSGGVMKLCHGFL